MDTGESEPLGVGRKYHVVFIPKCRGRTLYGELAWLQNAPPCPSTCPSTCP